MISVRHQLRRIRRTVFGRGEGHDAGRGITFRLGPNAHEPVTAPKLAVYWHPPLAIAQSGEMRVEKKRFRTWLSRFSSKRKSA